jgi:hypothetical protein
MEGADIPGSCKFPENNSIVANTEKKRNAACRRLETNVTRFALQQ